MLYTPTLPLLTHLLAPPPPPDPVLAHALLQPRFNDFGPYHNLITPDLSPHSPALWLEKIRQLSLFYPNPRLSFSKTFNHGPSLIVPLGSFTIIHPPTLSNGYSDSIPRNIPITLGPYSLRIPLLSPSSLSLAARAPLNYEHDDLWQETPLSPTSIKYGYYLHPHAICNTICLGDAHEPITRASTTLDLITICDLVSAVLSNYNPDSPYHPLHLFAPPSRFSLTAPIAPDNDDDDSPTCISCGDSIHSDETLYCNDDGPYCESCYSDRFSYCNHCQEDHPSDESRNVHVPRRRGSGTPIEEAWCSSCASSDAFKCAACHRRFHDDLCCTNDHDDKSYCESCYDDLSPEDRGLCPSCHEPVDDCTCDEEEESPTEEPTPTPLKEPS